MILMSRTATDRRRLWDKLPEETTDDFTRFQCYRGIMGKRSMLGAYIAYVTLVKGENEVANRRAINPYALKTAPASWSIMAEDNRWLERANAWDMYQHQLDITAEQGVIDECRDKRREALNSLLTTSIAALADFDSSAATLSQIAQAVKVAVSQLRIEYGEHEQFQLEALLSFLDPTTRGAIVLALRATPVVHTPLLPAPAPDTDTIDAE